MAMQNQAERLSQGFMLIDLMYPHYSISVPFPLVGMKKENICSHMDASSYTAQPKNWGSTRQYEVPL